MYWPPSTLMTSPVMCRALSLTRKAITSATSSGVPMRPRTTSDFDFSSASGGIPWTISVEMIPGQTTFTFTPNFPSSRATLLERPMTPALAAE